ncbi:hypothetical protein RFI_32431 [Reticulomyxa filosa]|uniref:Uncharacterized protein n=1 Tax=Reticulomyxa filosa TaxID=46433 RepID=X6LW78_RETFI|nr:hypothetical protein RFI_32431 [Reticulomyxa filosa]|eukprot:ETO04965.1 hypothetical protein RFI_32431 [Reticulomyxa filosa]
MDPIKDSKAVDPFLMLASLPVPLHQAQCVAYKDEILICGGFLGKICYSYHTRKNRYKYICSYPEEIKLHGHCVVKRINKDDPNEITLLSFGGGMRHALILNYESVWDDDKDDEIDGNKMEEKNAKNEWRPFTNDKTEPNHLLFITYRPRNIAVFDLNQLQCIKYDTLPSVNSAFYHCFVSKMDNEKDT